jgi:hypothetical protein
MPPRDGGAETLRLIDRDLRYDIRTAYVSPVTFDA